jgi:hypothetical protein
MTAAPNRGVSRPDAFSLDAVRSSPLFNKDLAPTPPADRHWGAYEFAALWVGMSICIPSYMLASGLMASGMSWRQALFTIFLGNVIVLGPMLLNSHAGAKYGIPFPVLARSAFGVLGANLPSVARALVACGWFGIQTWIGGQAIHTILLALWPAWTQLAAGPWICFFAFWGVNIWVVVRGIESIRFLEDWAAPFLLVISLALLGWAYASAGTWGPLFDSPGQFATFGEFLPVFAVSLTGMVGFWATLALNITDFTRYARNQRAQAVGQSLGLPVTMTLYSLLGIAVTSMTVALFGEPVWNPVALAGRMGHPLAVTLALIGVAAATLTTNVAASQRLRQRLAAPHQLPHRRAHHGLPRHRHDAVEAARESESVPPGLAGRLFGLPRADCRHPHLRLLPRAQAHHRARRPLPARRALRIRGRDQLARGGVVLPGLRGGVCGTRLSAAGLPLQRGVVRGLHGGLRRLLRADAAARPGAQARAGARLTAPGRGLSR